MQLDPLHSGCLKESRPAAEQRSFSVLLATFQGARHLPEQIQSLKDQTVDEVHILASDDGSTDDTVELLRDTQASWDKGKFRIIPGPQKGFEANFRELVLQSAPESDYYAFCDQDDIWDSNKLERAQRWSEGHDPIIPQVYASRTRWIDDSGASIGLSPVLSLEPSFAHALVQTIAGGNTMVMNRAAMELLKQTADAIGPFSHDRWLYLVVTGSGGLFHYSDRPSVSYRQHHGSVTGVPRPWTYWTWRLRPRERASMRRMVDRRIATVEDHAAYLTPDARAVLQDYKTSRDSASVVDRFRSLRRSGVHYLSFRNNVAQCVDCIFRIG